MSGFVCPTVQNPKRFSLLPYLTKKNIKSSHFTRPNEQMEEKPVLKMTIHLLIIHSCWRNVIVIIIFFLKIETSVNLAHMKLLILFLKIHDFSLKFLSLISNLILSPSELTMSAWSLWSSSFSDSSLSNCRGGLVGELLGVGGELQISLIVRVFRVI